MAVTKAEKAVSNALGINLDFSFLVIDFTFLISRLISVSFISLDLLIFLGP